MEQEREQDMPKYNVLDGIVRYEGGEMDEGETLELFQNLVDTGIAWHLQGSYGRTAVELIKAGRITARRA